MQLLGELLLERSNLKVMVKYVADEENLKLMMNLLKDQSRSIQFEAFHVFKVSVLLKCIEISVSIAYSLATTVYQHLMVGQDHEQGHMPNRGVAPGRQCNTVMTQVALITLQTTDATQSICSQCKLLPFSEQELMH